MAQVVIQDEIYGYHLTYNYDLTPWFGQSAEYNYFQNEEVEAMGFVSLYSIKTISPPSDSYHMFPASLLVLQMCLAET